MKKKRVNFCYLVRYGLDTFSSSVSPVLQVQLIDCCLQASGPVQFEGSRSLNALAWYFAMTVPSSPFKAFLIKGFDDVIKGESQRIDWGVLQQVFSLDPAVEDHIYDEHAWFLSSHMKQLMGAVFSDYSLSQLEVAGRRLSCMEVVLRKVRDNLNHDSVSDLLSGFESVDAFLEIDCYWGFIKLLTQYGVNVKLAEIDDMKLVEGVDKVLPPVSDGFFMAPASSVAPPSKDERSSEQCVPSNGRKGKGGQ